MKYPSSRWCGLLGVVLGLVGCAGDSPTPLEPPAASLGLAGGNIQLLTCSPLPYAKSSASIGSEGGTLVFGPHTLVVPRGALANRVTITAEVIPDSVNSVRFSPEGLQFAKSAALSLSYSNCFGMGMQLPKQVAYTSESLSILELLQSVDSLAQRRVVGQLKHFSRYAVAY